MDLREKLRKAGARETRALQGLAASEARVARAKKNAREAQRAIINQEIRRVGKFARDTGLTRLARLDEEAFSGLLLAVEDPREVERWRRLARGRGQVETAEEAETIGVAQATRFAEAAE